MHVTSDNQNVDNQKIQILVIDDRQDDRESLVALLVGGGGLRLCRDPLL